MLLTVCLVMLSMTQAPAGGAKAGDVRSTLENLEADWNRAHLQGDAAVLVENVHIELQVMRPVHDARAAFEPPVQDLDGAQSEGIGTLVEVAFGRLLLRRCVAGLLDLPDGSSKNSAVC